MEKDLDPNQGRLPKWEVSAVLLGTVLALTLAWLVSSHASWGPQLPHPPELWLGIPSFISLSYYPVPNFLEPLSLSEPLVLCLHPAVNPSTLTLPLWDKNVACLARI